MPRTGPVGRLLRLALAAALAPALASILDQGGPASFADPSNLTEPITWILHAAMLAVFVVLAGQLGASLAGPEAGRRWQLRGLAGLGVLLVVSALAAWSAAGHLWAPPLTDLVWAFDALMLGETIVALLLAVALGTPGCEVGVWPELIARVRGEGAASRKPVCVLGLHLLDEWEARRRRARTRTEA